MQLLDILAAVLENQVCSAMGEDLHVFVHAQHQSHLETQVRIPALPPASWEATGESLSLSEPRFP